MHKLSSQVSCSEEVDNLSIELQSVTALWQEEAKPKSNQLIKRKQSQPTEKEEGNEDILRPD